jgi:outer membrane receptor protein involved in Fe transport
MAEMMRSNNVLPTGAVIALLAWSPGYAQTTSGQTASGVPKAPAPGGLSQIIVTAQRRFQRLQDVPIAITAVGAKQLAVQRVFNIQNIASLTPSIHFGQANLASSGSNIQIRGIGTVGVARSFEGSVGVFIDGVYRTRSGEALTDFLDIDSLEILRGPQGTLFGKNTSAGAILLTSTPPRPDAVSGYYDFSYGNYNYYRATGAVNVAVSNDVTVRLAALQTDHDGYIKDVNGGTQNEQRDRAVKGQVLYEPNDAFRLRVIADYAEGKGNCCLGAVQITRGPVAPLIDALTLANGNKLPPIGFSNYSESTSNSNDTEIRDYGLTILGDWKIGDGTLHSVTGLRKYGLGQYEDADYSGADILSVHETFESDLASQEFTYTGKIEAPVAADYVFGAYASNEAIRIDRSADHGTQAQAFWDALLGAAGVPPAFIDARPGRLETDHLTERAQSYALFTHWTVKLADQWSAILGLRGTKDIKTGGVSVENIRDPILDPFAELAVLPKPFQSKTDTTGVTGTAGLEYHYDTNAMAYATYNRGYKAGGIILDDLGSGQPAGVLFGTPETFADPTYKPETIDGYEIGTKIDWLGNRARTNAALFYNNIQNLQVAQFIGLRFTVLSAPTAKVYGGEFEQTFELTPDITLTGAGTFLPEASFGDSALLGPPLSGRRFATAPHFTGQAAIQGQHHLTDDLALTGRVQLQYTGEYLTNTDANQTQNGFCLLNLNVGLASLSRHWTLEAWALNLLDKRYITQHFATPLQSGSYDANVGDPRTFGVTLRGTF